MFSSMKARTRCRISLISGVIFRSGICSSLSGREVLEPGKALFSLPRRVPDRRNEVHDGCGYAVFAIGSDLIATRLRTSIHEYILDDPRRDETDSLLTLSGLPGVHHWGKRVATAETLLERVIRGSREITGDDETPDHLSSVLVLSRNYEYAAGYIRHLLAGRLRRVIGYGRDPSRVIGRYVVRDDTVGVCRPEAQHFGAQRSNVNTRRRGRKPGQAESSDVKGANSGSHLLASECLLEERKGLTHASDRLFEGNAVPVLNDR